MKRKPPARPVGPPPLDRAALRQLAKLEAAPLRTMLLRALDAFDDDDVEATIEGFVPLDALRPARARGRRLLAEVREFATRSLAGEFYEGFNVNSRNFMEKSDGTRRWIAAFNDLADRVVAEPQEAVAAGASTMLLDLLEGIDEGESWLFFADEQGAFQVGADEAGLRRRAGRSK